MQELKLQMFFKSILCKLRIKNIEIKYIVMLDYIPVLVLVDSNLLQAHVAPRPGIIQWGPKIFRIETTIQQGSFYDLKYGSKNMKHRNNAVCTDPFHLIRIDFLDVGQHMCLTISSNAHNVA